MLTAFLLAILVVASLASLATIAAALYHSLAMRTLSRCEAGPSEAALARWPKVSLIVPARDEAATIVPALRSKLEDDYPDLEVIVVDDRSADETAGLVAGLCWQDERLRLTRVTELPEGWLGKVHALDRGVAEASGQWLLFSDADTHVEPGTLRRAVGLCEREGFDFLGVTPEWTGATTLVDSAIGWFMVFVHACLNPHLIEDPRRAFAVGVGAFSLARASAFRRSEGFPWLRMETADDVGLGILMQRSGARCAVADGRGLVRVVLYPTLRAAFRGIEKNSYVSLGGCTLWRVFAVVGALVLADFAPFGLLALPGPFRLAGVAVIAAHTIVSVAIVGRNNGRWAAGLLWPVGSLIHAAAQIRGGVIAHAIGGVRWRGTFYPSDGLRAGQRVRLGTDLIFASERE